MDSLLITPAVMEMLHPFPILLYLFFLDSIYLFLETGREEEREEEKHQCGRETLVGCLSHAPNWGPGPQPRHVP